MSNSESQTAVLEEKWAPILDHKEAPVFNASYKRKVTAQLLENQMQDTAKQREALTEDAYGPTNATDTSLIGRYDPILISLVRRSMPNLIAFDIAGVQPMKGPTGLIFALRPKYVEHTGDASEFKDTPVAFYDEPDTAHSGDQSGDNLHAGESPSVLNPYVDGDGATQNKNGVYTTGRAMETKAAEMLGTGKGKPFNEMGFEIDKMSITAKSRALKAKYSVELAQDMKAIHGLDAEQELANILSTEILAEINRELIRTVYATAKPGAQTTSQKGIFDLNVDANGRWSVERFKGLMYQIERDANSIAKETRRGKGNFIICSSDVASALAMTGVLDHNPALKADLEVDDTGNTFVGILNGRYKVYIDPYATEDYYVVGYKGSSHMDAGIYYAPYVPLQLYKAVDGDSFQPRLGFKTRYGLCSAPFAYGREQGDGKLEANKNVYFRRVGINNLM